MKHCIGYQNIENRAQYTKDKMNNAVKNQNYPKKLQYISLYQLFEMIVPRLMLPLSYDMRNEQVCKQLTSPGV